MAEASNAIPFMNAFFLKVFWQTHVLFCLFWISGDVSSGFHCSRIIHFFVYSLRSTSGFLLLDLNLRIALDQDN